MPSDVHIMTQNAPSWIKKTTVIVPVRDCEADTLRFRDRTHNYAPHKTLFSEELFSGLPLPKEHAEMAGQVPGLVSIDPANDQLGPVDGNRASILLPGEVNQLSPSTELETNAGGMPQGLSRDSQSWVLEQLRLHEIRQLGHNRESRCPRGRQCETNGRSTRERRKICDRSFPGRWRKSEDCKERCAPSARNFWLQR